MIFLIYFEKEYSIGGYGIADHQQYVNEISVIENTIYVG